MCRCTAPNVNGTPNAYSWDGNTHTTREPNPPALHDGDVLIYDEPGRCGGLDCHSHHFRLVRNGPYHVVRVRHGAGEEFVNLPCVADRLVYSLVDLDSNARFRLLHTLYSLHEKATSDAAARTHAHWKRAAAEKRIRTRKQRGTNAVKVWIEESAA